MLSVVANKNFDTMSEYGLSGVQQRPNNAYQYPQQNAANVEWYSGEASNYGAYTYDPTVASNSGAAYGTFEDEAPLLEGNENASKRANLGQIILQ